MHKRRNIGFFAHVDAGKTTLTEQVLVRSGAISGLGSVDRGTAHTDRLDIERRRGISIQSTAATLHWKGTEIALIDTPGHADFTSEVECSLWALDGAVLLLDALEGVQPQTEILFAAFQRLSMPVLLFINKMDRPGANRQDAIQNARASLSALVVDPQDDEQLQLLMAERDETALEDLLENRRYPRAQLLAYLARECSAGRAYPALCGSALHGEGMEGLLDAILSFLPPPTGKAEDELCGVVFAVGQDRVLGRAAHVRLFSGQLSNRDAIEMPGKPTPLEDHPVVSAKVSQIRTIPLEGRGDDIGRLSAGEIGAVYGLGSIRVGQVLGNAGLLPRRIRTGEIATPLLMVKATPADPARQNDLRLALETLSGEDPALGLETRGDALHLNVMGAIQLEVLQEQLLSRFGLVVSFEEPTVIYRETIARSAVGFYAYTMPKPCWAVIKFQMDPLPRGSGIVFESIVPAKDILPRYQHQVEQAVPLAIRQGMLGWRVDDVKITLIDGNHHLIHTHPLDFIVATPVAFLDGLRRGGSVLLEPVLEMRITLPEDAIGRVMSEIVSMRGEVVESGNRGDRLLLVAHVPLATSVHFSTRLSSLTSGRGAMSVRLHGYQEIDLSLGRVCERRGVHPLDTAKYILSARSALDGGIFDL